MAVTCSSETPVDFKRIIRYIPEDRTLHNHCYDVLELCISRNLISSNLEAGGNFRFNIRWHLRKSLEANDAELASIQITSDSNKNSIYMHFFIMKATE
jgi:hypothetical protein